MSNNDILFTVKGHDFTVEAIRDLLITCFDRQYGASRSWINSIQKIEPENWNHVDQDDAAPRKHWLYDYPLNPGGSLIILPLEDDEKVTLNLASLQKGMEILFEHYQHFKQDILDDNSDAFTADCFLQCCLFGEQVYG